MGDMTMCGQGGLLRRWHLSWTHSRSRSHANIGDWCLNFLLSLWPNWPLYPKCVYSSWQLIFWPMLLPLSRIFPPIYACGHSTAHFWDAASSMKRKKKKEDPYWSPAPSQVPSVLSLRIQRTVVSSLIQLGLHVIEAQLIKDKHNGKNALTIEWVGVGAQFQEYLCVAICQNESDSVSCPLPAVILKHHPKGALPQ